MEGIQYGPAVSQEDGASDADGGSDGRQGVAAVVPRIGFQGLGIEFPAFENGVTVKDFLRDNGR